MNGSKFGVAIQEEESLPVKKSKFYVLSNKSQVSRPKWKSTGIRILSVILFLTVWQLLVLGDVSWPLQFGNLPTPLAVLRSWQKVLLTPSYYLDILISVGRVTVGIVLGAFSGVLLGVWIGLSKKANDILFPTLEIFRPIPLIAFLPVAMLLFKTIEGSIIFITFIGAFFPILIATYGAVRRVPMTLIHASRCLGCSPRKLIWKIYLPAMAPELFTGLAVGVGASWMGVVTAEMLSGQLGIGYYTWQAYTLMQYNASMIGMFTIGLLGYLSSAFVRLIERRMIKWRRV